eukprot:1150889-Pelagomonas_calceolata.AAC.2
MKQNKKARKPDATRPMHVLQLQVRAGSLVAPTAAQVGPSAPPATVKPASCVEANRWASCSL